jgi:putative transposase
MKKQTRGQKKLEELIPDKARREEVLRRMYSGDPFIGKGGIFTDLLQAMVNAAMEGEMDASMEVSRQKDPKNRRNGHLRKTVRSDSGTLEIKTPRDRNGDYEPILIGKWDRELNTGMDGVILSLYARGQSVEDIRRQILQIYGVEISAGTISAVTDRVLGEITEWQQRPLSGCYPIVYLDAIHFKVREEGTVAGKAVYTVYGVNVDGKREVMGMYLGVTEGARQWGLILEDIKRRGVEDVFLFSVDGLKGFKEVIGEVYPQSGVQRCIVHMVRNSTRFVSYKDINKVCSDLRKVYTSADRGQAALALEAFGAKWDARYREIRPKWEENWDELTAFMDFGESIRRILYTTNPVEALHRVLRKVTKSKGAWSNEKGLIKQLYLTLMYNRDSWNRSVSNWHKIQRDLIEYYGERYSKHL